MAALLLPGVAHSADPTNGLSVSVVPAPPPTYSLWGNSDTPAVITANDPSAATLGVKFIASSAGKIKGIRFYKGPQNTGTHIVDLWSSSGTKLASATAMNETAGGWQEADFSSPVAISANTTYIASYHTNTGFYSADDTYFNNARTNGPLTAPSTTTSGGNGVYIYSASDAFPNTTYQASNYWVDLVFSPGVSSNTPPVANNDSGFITAPNTAMTLSAGTLLANDSDPDGDTLTVTGASNGVNGTVTFQNNAVTFTPTQNYTGPASFTYTISDGHGNSASAKVSLEVANSLWGNSDTPAVITANDPSAAVLGVKFTASSAGTIYGIRFYKGPQNTGTHVVDLWSSNGTKLASATARNETASGWQEADFSSPVAVSANTTYIASYHTNTGFYSGNSNYFTSARTNGPLTAPSTSTSGGNGVYAYSASDAFPTSTYQASNYWVDVGFRPNVQTPPQTIASISPTTARFTSGTGSANKTVQAFTITMNPAAPAFSGTCSISGTDAAKFVVDPSTCTLRVGSTDLPAGTYNVNVVASEASIGNQPASQAVTVTGTAPIPGVMRAFDFYNKFGVGTDLTSTSLDQVVTDVNYLGFNNIRSGVSSASAADAVRTAQIVRDIINRGLRVHLIVGDAPPYYFNQMSDLISAFQTYVVPAGINMVTGMSGPNEPDVPSPVFCYVPGVYGGECGIPAADQAQHDLYTMMKSAANPSLNNVSIDMWPMGWLEYTKGGGQAVTNIGDQSAYCQRANLHDYYDNDPSGSKDIATGLQTYYVNTAKTVCNHPHFITTESGWKSICSFGPTYGEYVQARYTLRNMFEHAMRPELDLFYIFTLEWSDNPPDCSGGWGVLNNDGSPKIAGTAIHNLMPLLKDTGATAQTFTTSAFNYTLSGMPAAGRNFVIEKSNGHYLILLWNNAQICGAATAPPWDCNPFVNVSPVPVTINLPSSMSGTVYAPIPAVVNGPTTTVQTFTNQTAVTVSLGDAPLIIDVSGG